MNKKTFFSLLQYWKGTSMENVMNILNTGEFIESSRPIKKNKILGEMSPLEKAIYSQLILLDKEMKKNLKSLTSVHLNVSVDCFDCILYKRKLCPLYKKIHHIEDEYDVETWPLQAILSRLVYERFGVSNSLVAQKFLLISTDDKFKTHYNPKTKENKSPQELFEESIKGTFLETIVNSMESEKFLDLQTPIKEGDTKITELNPYGKAILNLIYEIQAKIKKNSEQLEFTINLPITKDLRDSGLEIMVFDLKNSNAVDKMSSLMSFEKTLKIIFHGAIETVILSEALENNDKITIRHGFHVVKHKVVKHKI